MNCSYWWKTITMQLKLGRALGMLKLDYLEFKDILRYVVNCRTIE